MGGLTQSSQTQTTQTNSAPWAVQQPYLQQAFGTAAQNLNAGAGGVYNGQQVAQFSPDQLAIFRRMTGYGDTGNADAISGAGAGAATSGSNAVQDALRGMAGYTPTGGVESNINAAAAYANNPETQGMIDAAMRDARRSVSEQALPGIARASAVSGNTMSSRRGISEGIVERGLAEKTADVSSNIRGQQFDKGLALAEGGRQFDNSAILDALKARAGAGASALGAGTNAVGGGVDAASNIFNIANSGADGAGRVNSQNSIDNAKAMSEYGADRNNALLQAFYSIVGGNNWGGTSNGTATTTSNPSIWNTIGSALGVGASLYKLSDRRFKHDIRCIGQADNGLPIYTFRYLDDPKQELQMGFMAQDVEKVKPEAVANVNGVLVVNYELASA